MANEFSFGPNPAYAWGGHPLLMGSALLQGMTNGLGFMHMWDQYQREANTTPSWVAGQQATNAAQQSAGNLHDWQNQTALHYMQSTDNGQFGPQAGGRYHALAPAPATQFSPLTVPPQGAPTAAPGYGSYATDAIWPAGEDYYGY